MVLVAYPRITSPTPLRLPTLSKVSDRCSAGLRSIKLASLPIIDRVSEARSGLDLAFAFRTSLRVAFDGSVEFTLINSSTISGSYIDPRRSRRIWNASSVDNLGRYVRSDVRASNQPTTAGTLPPIGICVPLNPAGYPEPFQFS